MEIIGIVSRLMLAIALSVLLSVLAMKTINLTGTDLKDFKQRNKPIVLMIAGFFNILFIVAVVLLLRIWDHKTLSELVISFSAKDIMFLIFVLVISLGFAVLLLWLLHLTRKISIEFVSKQNNAVKNQPWFWGSFIILFIASLQE